MTNLTSMSISNNTTNTYDTYCGEEYKNQMLDIRFWFEGILVVILGIFGLAGNIMSMIVLSRPRLRDVFHRLLFALACFDILYITIGGISYSFRALKANSTIFTYLFPYFIHPMSHVAMIGTIYTTTAISIERYLGLCHPMMPLEARKTWYYVVPVIIATVVLSSPTFFEVELVYQGANGTEPAYGNTLLRLQVNYIRYYKMWTSLFLTGIIPVALLLYLNTRIAFDLFSSSVRRFGTVGNQRKEFNLCILLFCIVLIFLCCHAARIILNFIEFLHIENIIKCRQYVGRPWLPAFQGQVLAYVSHLLMILNSSVNFIVYSLVGQNFRRELCRIKFVQKLSNFIFGANKKDKYRAVPMMSKNGTLSNQTSLMPTETSKLGSLSSSDTRDQMAVNGNNGLNRLKDNRSELAPEQQPMVSILLDERRVSKNFPSKSVK